MSVIVTNSFLESVFSLDKRSIKNTFTTVSELDTNPKSNALQIHKLERCKCDDSFRSARVNDDVRIIFADHSGAYTLLYVGHHEDAYDWCEGKFFAKTSFGAEMIYDEKQFQADENYEPKNNYFGANEKSLLEKQNIKVKQLVKIDIPEVHAKNLLKIIDEDEFLDYIQIFPQEIQEALYSLAAGEKSYDEIFLELHDSEFEQGATTEHKDTQRRFHMLQDLHELEELLLGNEFEKWAIFLHPNQERLVKMNFRGPALIEGGPGTGKTIVGIHRAVYLADRVFPKDQGGKVLLCSFSKKLALYIDGKLDYLLKLKGQTKENIDVRSVDSYITSMYAAAYGHRPAISTEAQINSLLSHMYSSLKPSGSLEFYQLEYKEIIEQEHIRTLEDYLACDRTGLGNLPLSAAQRTKVWSFFDAFLREKQNQNIISFVDVAYAVHDALTQGRVPLVYDSIVIDEAQDLEPIKLRILAHSVRSDHNNVFILSDVNQRIFKLNSWRKNVGISIVGRSYYLSINYRTTKQISDYARNQFAASELVTSHIRDYQSIVNGEPPRILSFTNVQEQAKFIVNDITDKLNDCPPEQICVICPSYDDCRNITYALQFGSVKCVTLQNDLLPASDQGVCVCTIKGVKGLEFRIVYLYNYDNIEQNSASVEIRKSYRKLAECEKYVAATRARDELVITYTEEDDDE